MANTLPTLDYASKTAVLSVVYNRRCKTVLSKAQIPVNARRFTVSVKASGKMAKHPIEAIRDRFTNAGKRMASLLNNKRIRTVFMPKSIPSEHSIASSEQFQIAGILEPHSGFVNFKMYGVK